MPATAVHRLELDLDVFAGPFDLLLSLILREELDLLEVELAEVVLAYLDHLEARDELDLEATTEFLVLIAALLELKSRLMLPGEEVEELDELAPAEAAEELLERMLRYARFRGAAGWLGERAGQAEAVLYRSAPLPDELRRLSVEQAEASYDPARARRGARRAAAHAAAGRPEPHGDAARHARRAPGAPARAAARAARFGFDEAVEGADRVTVAVTLFALLELYKRGEASWEQAEPFGPITVARRHDAAGPHRRGAAVPLARAGVARRPARRDRAGRVGGARRAGRAARRPRTAAASCCKEVAGGWTLASHPGAEEAARRLLSRPRTPALTPAQAETLAIVAYLQPVSRPEMARIRGVASESATAALVERGLIEEAGRSQFGAVLYRTTPLFLKLFGLRSLDELPELEQWDPSPEDQAALRDRLLRAGDERSGVSPLGRCAAFAASCPQAASMSRPRVRRTVARRPCSSSAALNAAIAPREEPS